MSTETAQIVIAVIGGVGFIAWLAGLQFVLISARAGKTAARTGVEIEEPLPRNWLLGNAEVEGQPAPLCKRAAALLARHGQANFGPVKIIKCTDDRLVFERVGPTTGNVNQAGSFRRGELRFIAQGREKTCIDYAVECSSLHWLLWLAGLFLVLGLIALIVGAWLLTTLVAWSGDPAIRWQTIQMVQVLHFLWPPFLFAALYRRGIRVVRAAFEAFTNNLPYTDAK